MPNKFTPNDFALEWQKQLNEGYSLKEIAEESRNPLTGHPYSVHTVATYTSASVSSEHPEMNEVINFSAGWGYDVEYEQG